MHSIMNADAGKQKETEYLFKLFLGKNVNGYT
jgi:hypothetical protein